jgi:hypothetical protein
MSCPSCGFEFRITVPSSHWPIQARVRPKAGQAEYDLKQGKQGGIEYVYLLKGGPHYKIGMSTDPKKRFDQIALQIPFRVTLIHTIETDDGGGIEKYWHKRFANKRTNGEWFRLNDSDVEIFCSRLTM